MIGAQKELGLSVVQIEQILIKGINPNTISVYFINKVNAILDRRNNTKSDWDVINSVRVYEVPIRTWYKQVYNMLKLRQLKE